MTKKNETQGLLSQAAIDAAFEKLDSLASQLRQKAGSAAQRKAEAKLAVLNGTAIVDYDEIPEVVRTFAAYASGWKDAAEVGINLGYLAEAAVGVCAWANQLGDEATTQYLKSQGTPEDLTLLKDQYEEAKKSCEALLQVADAGLIPKEMLKGKVIAMVRTPRSSGGGGKPAGKSFGHFYRILPSGERRYQSAGQDKLSSMAWYFGAIMCGKPGEGTSNDGKGVPVPELEAYLRANVTDSPIGKAWEYEVQTDAGNVRFGFEVTSDQAAPADEEE